MRDRKSACPCIGRGYPGGVRGPKRDAALAAGVAGYAFIYVNWIERLLLIAGALLSLFVGHTSDLIGLALIAIAMMNQMRRRKAIGGHAAFSRKAPPANRGRQ